MSAEGRGSAPAGARGTTATRTRKPAGPTAAGHAAKVRAAVTAWLARPLTSLHIVLGVFGLLTLVGLVMVLSASSVESFEADGSSYSVFARQLLFCLAGLVVFWIGMRIPPKVLRALAPAALILSVILLVLVLIPGLGHVRGGARSWFVVGPISIQPAELAKVAMALWGAHVLAARQRMLGNWRQALSPVLPVALVLFTLIVIEPDLGTALSLAIVVAALLFFAGVRMRLLAALGIGGAVGAVMLGLSAGYRQSRITSFLSPDASDPLGSAYQAKQALYSLADGGLFGVGIGQGRAKWSYLPNAHNDFIYAIIGEELGMVGAVAVLVLFGMLVYVGLRIAARNTDPWLKLVVSSLTVWMAGQATINIGYVVGLLPVTGIPLPLVSSGGSALVSAMFVGGLLANAARHEPEAIAALRAHGQGRVARLLGLRMPEPYRSPIARSAARPTAPSPRTPPQSRTAPSQRASGARAQVPGQRGHR
ncbi:putative lipid II flippase FtsW [Pseudonocardia spinosispora]|uniref:putative lipid II flippase FtsW n=1 Tax=Pseudonocardia spinosispora TaxID=103441 RepID=UPI000688759F|nr:putative lipid II flippase FtsW [Pseudonocardia spinosispora]